MSVPLPVQERSTRQFGCASGLVGGVLYPCEGRLDLVFLVCEVVLFLHSRTEELTSRIDHVFLVYEPCTCNRPDVDCGSVVRFLLDMVNDALPRSGLITTPRRS